MTAHCTTDLLLHYWLGELDQGAEAAVEEHYFGCAECAGSLEQLVTLADGVEAAFAAGAVGAFVTESFVARLAATGMRVRYYRVPRNGSVNCTVSPEDQLVVSHLEAPLDDVVRVDAIVGEHGQHRLEDVPFDRSSGTVVLAPHLRNLRAMPAHRQVVRLLAVDERGERLLGDYTFNHTPG